MRYVGQLSNSKYLAMNKLNITSLYKAVDVYSILCNID